MSAALDEYKWIAVLALYVNAQSDQGAIFTHDWQMAAYEQANRAFARFPVNLPLTRTRAPWQSQQGCLFTPIQLFQALISV